MLEIRVPLEQFQQGFVPEEKQDKSNSLGENMVSKK